MSYQIIGGGSQRFYHTVPSDLDLITTSPTRDAIFKYLSQIGDERFPEFVLDILIKVEGHRPGDVTDGVGDEKQDIITISPSGQRCLTQCKHTINYKAHYNGDELDRMVAATIRKNCSQAIFVTNSDLTPQGKKYVTDEEYNRGLSASEARSIDYWNGFKIWERVKNNTDIIHKWFSGLGQVHGLRSFKFDLTVQPMPYVAGNEDAGVAFDKLIDLLGERGWFVDGSDKDKDASLVTDRYTVRFARWFQFTGALDIDFLLPGSEYSFVNRPMYALTAEVIMRTEEKYIPSVIREEIVCKIGDELLDKPEDHRWWHVTTSPIKSFIYLHDIAEPRELKLASAMTFVKVDKNTIREIEHCAIRDNDFEFDGESVWVHTPSGIQVMQAFNQQLNPVEVYDQQIAQLGDIKRMASFDFFAVSPIDSSLMMRVRRVLKKDWIALQHDNDTLIWAFDPDEDADEVAHYHQKVRNLHLEIKQVDPQSVPTILSKVQTDLPPAMFYYIMELASVNFPIKLNERMFWLSKDLTVNKPMDLDIASHLISIKFHYEKQHGFDNMNGKTTERLNSSEVPDLLFDIHSFRGTRMVDIAVRNNPISIHVRFREEGIESSLDLVNRYIAEFNKLYNEIDALLNGSA